jgi:hypothetical protein
VGSSLRAATSHGRYGLRHGRRCRSRQVCPGCSPPATSGTGRSDVSPALLAKARSRWALSTDTLPTPQPKFTHHRLKRIGLAGTYDQRGGA